MTVSGFKTLPGVVLAASVLWMIASMHAVGTIRAAGAARDRHAARSELLERLSPSLDRMTSQGVLRARLIDALDAQDVFEFGDWLGALATSLPTPTLQERRTPSGTFWRICTVKADWDAIAPEDFGELVRTAESRFPPLRLVSVTLDPLPEEPFARVSATFETLLPLRQGP